MITKILVAALIFIMAPLSGWADSFTLPYQKQNRWVASEEADGLRALMRHAKQTKQIHYYIQLPADNRDLSIARLIVLRDMLERHLRDGLVLEEIQPHIDGNVIIIHTKKPA